MKILLVIPKPMCRTTLNYTDTKIGINHMARLDYAPSGIAYVASYLLFHNKDIDVKIIDFGINDFSDQIYTQELQDFRPDIVGISISTIHYFSAVQISNLTRKFSPKILIVVGGPHATARPKDCLVWCDIVVRGEGELTFNDIVQRRILSCIKGISYKYDGKILHNPPRERIKNLDELPLPAYHLLKIKNYSRYPTISIVGSRGCPYNCTFCFSPIMWEKRMTMRSPRNIVDEIEFLHDTYGCNGIIFHDDTLNIPLERGIQICNELIRRGLNKDMHFECQLRMNRQFISHDLFKKMKDANFTKVMFGIESGSRKVLDMMNKSLSIEEIKVAIEMSKKEGLMTEGFFMIGNYGEGILDILKTCKLIIKTKLDKPAFAIAVPFPETGFYNLLKKEGYIRNELDWSYANARVSLVRTDKFSRRDIYLLFRLISSFFALKNSENIIQLFKKKLESDWIRKS